MSCYETVWLWSRRLPLLLKEAVKIYRSDGREFERLDDNALAAAFVERFRNYALDPADPGRSRCLNAIAGEYVLRRQDAPILPTLEETDRRIGTIVGPCYSEDEPSLARLPLVLLTFGHVLWIPRWGALGCLNDADETDRSPDAIARRRLREAVEHRDFDWVLCIKSKTRQ